MLVLLFMEIAIWYTVRYSTIGSTLEGGEIRERLICATSILPLVVGFLAYDRSGLDAWEHERFGTPLTCSCSSLLAFSLSEPLFSLNLLACLRRFELLPLQRQTAVLEIIGLDKPATRCSGFKPFPATRSHKTPNFSVLR